MNTPNEHIVKRYDEELQRLNAEITKMGRLAVAQLEAAMDVIEHFDPDAAARIIAADAAIDALEQSIAQDVMRLALRGPLARDLREILAGVRVPAEIERIGDHAANVARRSRLLAQMSASQQPVSAQLQGLLSLGRLAAAQVLRAIEAFQARDVDAALALRADDIRLDAQYTALFRQLLTWMMEDPRSITACTHLLFMARNMERVGDHATNIAENLWYLVHGDSPLPEREKADGTSSS